MNNELAGAVLTADIKAQYDAQCKLVLSQKEVLAWILQGVAEEFALLSREEIKACIEGMPGISSVSVAPGGTGGRITGLETESRIEGEGRVVYDIRFPANLPGHGRLVRLLIDVEAQKDYYPGYQLPTRGIFYGARMISSQLGTEFSGSNYDGLKKVYSIWICMGVPKKIGNAVTEYRMEKRDIRPGFPDRREAYDKLSVIMIGLNGQAGCGEGFLLKHFYDRGVRVKGIDFGVYALKHFHPELCSCFEQGDMMKLLPQMAARGEVYDVVNADCCQLVHEDFNVILRETRAYFDELGATYKDKKTHRGFLRYLLIRRAVNTGELLVDLVTTSQPLIPVMAHNLINDDVLYDPEALARGELRASDAVNVYETEQVLRE